MKSKLTTLCYIEKDGKYLMLHRVSKEKDINKGKWVGVGGHAEEGESPEDCLLREVKEETGLTLTDYRFRELSLLQVRDIRQSICVCIRQTVLPEHLPTVMRAFLPGWIKVKFPT